MATTLVVSDLHLGGRTGADVLRKPEMREPLLAAVRGIDRLVLLGDVLELRHGPPREALGVAEPFFHDLARALDSKTEVVLVAGNHDHQAIEPWLERRGRAGSQAPLGLEQRVAPARASWISGRMAAWLGEERTSVAYPGLWLREDVYAMHGNFIDLFSTIPTFERLGAAMTSRVISGALPQHADVDDFLARLEPVYAWTDTVARHARGNRAARGAGGAAKAYEMLSGSGPRPLRARLLGAAFPIVVAALNRAGLGPLSSDLAGAELRRASLRAMEEVARRLDIEAEHLVFGHSHRAGPLPGDADEEWRTATGARLHNTGCWVYESHFLSGEPGKSPYWPGSALRLVDDAPPRLERLLTGVSATQLAA